jgi:ParB-like chromosome segregation protein Spo0J
VASATRSNVDDMTDTRRSIRYVPLDKVQPADRNPKTHDHAVLRSSIDRFGFVEPIVRDDRTGRLVAGHGRIEQLRQARARDRDNPPDGVTVNSAGDWCVPVIVGWSSADDNEAQAYVIAANRAVELGGWDDSILTEALASLTDLDEGLAGVGYSIDDALALLAAQTADEFADEDVDVRPQLPGLQYRVVVECADETHQAAVLEQLDDLGLDVRAVVN